MEVRSSYKLIRKYQFLPQTEHSKHQVFKAIYENDSCLLRVITPRGQSTELMLKYVVLLRKWIPIFRCYSLPWSQKMGRMV